MPRFKSILYLDNNIDNAQKASSVDVLREFMKEYRGYGRGLCGVTKKHLRVTSKDEAEIILREINDPGGNDYLALQDVQSYHDVWQQMDYVKSNLKTKGYIFYFICSGCEARVRFLYEPNYGQYWRCRECHGLKYKRGQKARLARIPKSVTTTTRTAERQVARKKIQEPKQEIKKDFFGYGYDT
jgi:Zn-finger protein